MLGHSRLARLLSVVLVEEDLADAQALGCHLEVLIVSDGPRRLSGEAHDGTGPLLLAWDSVRRETRSRVGRRNVVIHEVAHKLDMLADVLATLRDTVL